MQLALSRPLPSTAMPLVVTVLPLREFFRYDDNLVLFLTPLVHPFPSVAPEAAMSSPAYVAAYGAPSDTMSAEMMESTSVMMDSAMMESSSMMMESSSTMMEEQMTTTMMDEATSTVLAESTSAMYTPSYGSGSANWNSGYNDCVQRTYWALILFDELN